MAKSQKVSGPGPGYDAECRGIPQFAGGLGDRVKIYYCNYT